ncbi:MAG TPA: hypothetical protein VKU61_13445, partial [Candidatus Binatia bacterium]|nr:hypothetical protein [Candidatus Binatia bacterium]
MSLAVSSVRSPAGEVATDAAAVARTRRASWLVLLPLTAALAVFAPVHRNPLGYDDLMHLYNLVNFGVLELTMTPHAGHLLFFSNLMYVPLYALFGVQPTAYSVVSLVTHLVNVALCYAVLLRLTGRPLAAALATSLWGCAAFHDESVGTFSVYGQLVAATILLVLLHGLVDGRPARPTRALVVETLLLVAAAGSIGYGLLVAALWPAIRAYVADESVTWRGIVFRLIVSAVAVAVLYAGVGFLHDAISNRPPYGSGKFGTRLRQASANDALLFVYATLERLGYGLGNTFLLPVGSLIAVPRVTPRLLGAWLG